MDCRKLIACQESRSDSFFFRSYIRYFLMSIASMSVSVPFILLLANSGDISLPTSRIPVISLHNQV